MSTGSKLRSAVITRKMRTCCSGSFATPHASSSCDNKKEHYHSKHGDRDNLPERDSGEWICAMISETDGRRCDKKNRREH